MPSVYSGNYAQGQYCYMRVRVDYSGSSATAHLLFSRTNTWAGQEYGTSTFTCGGVSTTQYLSNSGYVIDKDMCQVTFGINPRADQTVNFSYTTGFWNAFSGSITIPSQATAPTGLWCDGITRKVESFTARVYITGWGNYPSDDGNARYRELQCWTKHDSQLITPRRYQAVRGTGTSSVIEVGNSSAGDLNIRGNTMYTLGLYASNGVVSTGSIRVGNYTTAPYAATLTLNEATSDSLSINYSTPASGGQYTQTLQYSVDGGSTWANGATITGTAAKTGSFVINGLNANTEYTIQHRVTTEAGTTVGTSITGKTLGPSTPTITVRNLSPSQPTRNAGSYEVANFGGGSDPIVCVYTGVQPPIQRTLLHTSSALTGSFSEDNLILNSAYYYRARAGATFGSGKNYFKVPDNIVGRIDDNSFSKSATSAGTGSTSFSEAFFDLEPRTTYTISYVSEVTGDNLNRAGYVRLQRDDEWTNIWDNTGKLTFTTGDTGSIKFGFYNFWNDNNGGSNTVAWSDIQLEKGSEKTAFTPHDIDFVYSPFSDRVRIVTPLPTPEITSGAVVEYQTVDKVKVRLAVSIPADGGFFDKDVKYLYSLDGGSSWLGIYDFTTLTSGDATTLTIDVPNLPVETEVRFRVYTQNEEWESEEATFSLTTSGVHQGPTNFDYRVQDGNSSLRSWINSFPRLWSDWLYVVQGQSQVQAVVAENGKGTCSDGAIISKYVFDLVSDNNHKEVTTFNYPITVDFGVNTPVLNSGGSSPSASVQVRGEVIDSLDASSVRSKSITCLLWEAPSISVSGERTAVLGNARIDISGAYSRLQDNGLNNGNDLNSAVVQYRVLDLNREVIKGWTNVEIHPENSTPPKFKEFSERVQVDGIPFGSSCIVEVKIEDHFVAVTDSILLDIWDTEQVHEPVGCDIELWDWKTNTFVADLSYLVVGELSIDWELNDVEEISFDMDLMEFEKKCEEMGVNSEDLLKPYAHDIRIRRNGEYIVGCQLVDVNINLTNNPPATISIKGTGFLNLLKDQYILNEAWGGYTYAQIARKLVESAQKPDCLIKNPTGDIDTSYWLSPHGTVSYSRNAHSGSGCIAGSRSGAGWISAGSQMNVDTGQRINVDVWVKGQSGVVCSVRERRYITESATQLTLRDFTMNGSWQHIQINDYAVFFEDSYILFECNRTDSSTPIYIDDCYIYATNDDASLCNLNIPLGVDTASPLQENNRQFNYELQNVKDALIDLTNMEDDNFEFEFLPDRTFNVYDRKGEDKIDLEVAYPGNISSMMINRSATNVANKVIMIGSGIGDERLQVNLYNNTSRRVLGTRESVITESNISLEETLKGKGVGTLYDRKDPSNLPRITIKDGSVNPSNIQTGDIILVEVDDSKFAHSVTGTYRVVKISYSLSEESVESMILTVEPPLQRPRKKMIRYIRDSINGSSANASNHWVEIEALVLVGNEYLNVALGKPVTASAPPVGSEALARVTNGNINTNEYAGIGTGNQAVTIDLGSEYPVDYIRVWHYYGDSRRYKDNILSVGTELPDGTGGRAPLEDVLWQYSGEGYVESSNGRRSRWLQEENIVEG